MPFVCFLGNSLSDLLEPPKACQGALSQLPSFTSSQPPWFLILSADNQIDPCLTCTCLSCAQWGCFSCSPIRLFRPGYPRGRTGRFMVRDSLAFDRKRWTCVKNGVGEEKIYKLLTISTSNWNFMCHFLQDPEFLSASQWDVWVFFSSKEQDERSCFQVLFIFGCMRAFSLFLWNTI